MSERFTDWSEPGSVQIGTPQQCARCAHLRDPASWRCDAFPGGIPAKILTDRHDHRTHYPGDNGIRFAPRPGQRHPAEDDE